MEDLTTRLSRLHRPRLLVDAAREGQALYDRNRDLSMLLGRVPGHGAAVMQLFDMEAAQETARRGRRGYRVRRHVAILTALVAEHSALRSAHDRHDLGHDLKVVP
ncbi:DUF6477 family protein [Pseudooceanicola onchidii]|uniref:DUF6477 family protein n=1 Tax=Pseudooceanicola onchidii TaxID=2562279 RepID=UPI0010AAC1BD|nr:DUF6477 family protein [Pseudooceanicola onchidii]